MDCSIIAARLALGFTALAAVTAPAQALPNRILVSAKSGADSAGCGVPASPCRTFQYAHDNVAAGGEVQVMTPGDYLPVHITKAISIVNDGPGAAGVLQTPPMGVAVTIDAGASDRVTLRGLDIEDNGVAQIGVQLNTAAFLNIAKCTVRGFANNSPGIYIAPISGTTAFSITDTLVSGNTMGIRVFPQMSGQASGVIEHVTATGNTFGIEIIGPASLATISRSVVSNNQIWGVLVQGQGGYSVVSARDVVASHNGPGTGDNYKGSGFITTDGLLRLSHSVATGNEYGVTVNGGSVESYGDNDLRGNVNTNINTISGSFAPVAQQ